jgi:hypothetical protein
MDHSEAFHKHLNDPIKARKLESLGFLQLDCISYVYNRLGFRAEEFDDRPAGIALGCSFTEGVGIPLAATWPAQLSNMLGQHVWNLGVGGGSADTAYNLLEHYIDQLSTKFVVMCVPPRDRFEFFRDIEPIRILGSNFEIPPLYKTFFMEWFSTEKNSETNQKKNIRAIQQLCLQHGLPFYYLLVERDFILDQNARDLSHAGAESNRDFATKMYNLINQPI